MAKSHRLTLAIYKATAEFPQFSQNELYRLTSQIRHSCSFIAANIAGGCGRTGDAELARFLQIAMGSASELEYYPLLGHDLGFLEACNYEQIMRKTIEMKRILTGLIQRFRNSGDWQNLAAES